MKDPTSEAIFGKTNQIVEKYSKIEIFGTNNVVIYCFINPKSLVSLINHYWFGKRRFWFGTANVVSDYFPILLEIWSMSKYCFRLPYDWKSPIGYLVAIFAQFLSIRFPIQYIGFFFAFAFSAFMFGISSVKDLKDKLHSINGMTGNKKSRRKMYKKFSEFIRTHANTKQLSEWSTLNIPNSG